jgi:hypothetical protein
VRRSGERACRLLESWAPSGAIDSCDDLPGRIAVGTEMVDGVVRLVCAIVEDATGVGTGWRYDPASGACPRDGHAIDTADVALVPGSVLRLRCELADAGAANGIGDRCGNAAERGWGCGPTGDVVAAPIAAECDPLTWRCNVPCASDGECLAAGLLGARCASRGYCEPGSD